VVLLRARYKYNNVDVMLYFMVIGLLGLIPGRSESVFSSQNIHVCSEANLASCSVETRGHLPWIKAAGVVGLTAADLHKVSRLTVWRVTSPLPYEPSWHGPR
jgi:hypothetical protein